MHGINPPKCLYVQKRREVTTSELSELAQRNSVKIVSRDGRFLDDLAGGANHQGFALELESRKYYTLKEFLLTLPESGRVMLLALDEIYDPQNLGSIIRSAECFGVTAVMWSKNRGVGVTPAVTKVSAGASEIVPLIPVSNLRSDLNVLKENGFWVIAAHGESAGEKRPVQSLFELSFPERAVLVLGSEGKGVQPLILQEADIIAKIPMTGRIGSLNVGQAAVSFLTSWTGSLADASSKK
ncbi:MAG: 23S rRNA (guanosine(2251)-2'-O)-methyltransferase RlmB [Bdellovibrionales bacterium]|nr:23S rRNA (guanosine(2251)-2'-O)-methyltransferase RlmB [Bdellovibrionales bacterium]